MPPSRLQKKHCLGSRAMVIKEHVDTTGVLRTQVYAVSRMQV